MAGIMDKIGNLIDLENLGEKIDLGGIRDRIDLNKLGKKIDLDRLTDILDERRARKTTRWVIIVLAIIGVAAIAIAVA